MGWSRSARSQGSVSLTGAKGRIDVHSVNEDVEVSASSGEINAETVNGDVTLDAVDATSVTATSVNGDVAYDGPIKSGGRYALSTHNGDITVTVAEGTSASVSVSTFNGEFELRLPGHAHRDPEGQALQLHHRRRQRPGDAGVVPGHHRARAPRTVPGRTRRRPRR